jgi:ApaG protein
MKTKTTAGVKVSAETTYQWTYSNPLIGKYIFSYAITITNHGKHTVQLLRREWEIEDTTWMRRRVAGDGVVGEQPVLAPGELFQYASWCHLMSDMGRMWGKYFFKNLDTDEEFEVDIPEFQMIAPFKGN